MLFILSNTACASCSFYDSEADSRNMHSMNYNMFYIQDHSILSEINKSLESTISNCWDIDIRLDEMIQENMDFVDHHSNNLSYVTSNFDDDVIYASMCNADIVDAASPAVVSYVATSVVKVSCDLAEDKSPMTVSVVAFRLVPITDSSGPVYNVGYALHPTMVTGISSVANATPTMHDGVWGANSYVLSVEACGCVSSEVFTW